ncbi:MAG TPA: ABC transporter ATP-binding protein [Clostridia bacterium]|nr:ABC transporter ATP-binding protein [Clostridia bacterium]
MAEHIVELKNVSKVYVTDKVVDNVSLDIEKGEIFVLIGPSGCGKTTLLKMINQLVPHTEGEIYVKGQDVKTINPVELRRTIGYVIQYVGLLPHLTIRDNIAFVLQLKKYPKKVQRERAEELIQTVGLPVEYLNRHPRELSGGQQQRVGVARALAADPEILLMDEPFGAVDPVTREQLQNELLRLQENIRKSIVFVTHDMQEAFKVGDRIGLMNKGKIVALGRAMDILRTEDEFVKTFIGQGAVFNALEAIPVSRALMANVPRLRLGVRLDARTLQDGWDSIFVTDDAGRAIGFIERKDLSADGHVVEEALVPLPEPVLPKLSVRAALEKMLWQKRTWLPVVSEDDIFLGIITFESCSTLLES